MEPIQHYQDIGETLQLTQEAQSGKMFGMPCLKIRGKAFAGFYQEHMVFKLRGTPLEEALGLEGVRLFDPMGGRPMKEWVQVPFSHADRWEDFAERALSLQREVNG